MKTRQASPAPSVLSVNFVSSQLLLAEKVARYYARSRKYSVSVSEEPLPENGLDAYIVPFDALKKLFLNKERPETWLPVIAFGSPLFLAEAFGLGCRDYLKDPWDLAELDLRLDRVLRHPSAATAAVPGVVLAGNKVKTPEAEAVLKPNEARILKVLLKAGGEVVSREVLYYAIWGKVKNEGSRVVDVHVSALRKKLKSLTDLHITQVRGEGYLLS